MQSSSFPSCRRKVQTDLVILPQIKENYRVSKIVFGGTTKNHAFLKPCKRAHFSWASLKTFRKEFTKRQREREQSLKKREKSLKKGEFSLEKNSLLKNSLSQRKFSFHFLSTSSAFSTSSKSSNSSNTSNASIFMFIHFSS